MSNPIYQTTASKLLNKLKQYGMPIKIRKLVGTTTSTFGIWSISEDIEKDGLSISTKTMIVPSLKYIPEVSDKIVIKADTYSINKVKEYKPADIVIGYALEVNS